MPASTSLMATLSDVMMVSLMAVMHIMSVVAVVAVLPSMMVPGKMPEMPEPEAAPGGAWFICRGLGFVRALREQE